MKHRGIALVFVLLFASIQHGNSQESVPESLQSPFQERIGLLTDRDLYMAGEHVRLFVRLFLYPENYSGQLSNILYVEIFHENGKIIKRSKFPIKGNTVNGQLGIPESAKSGNYYLRAYTRYQQNFNSELIAHIPLIIIHPETIYFAEEDTVSSDIAHTYHELQLQLNKEIVERNSDLELNVVMPKLDRNDTLDVCISIVPSGAFLNAIQGADLVFSPHTLYTIEQLPDIREISLSGKVVGGVDQQPIQGAKVYASEPFVNPQFHFSKTDEAGRFIFSFTGLVNENTLNIGLIGEDPSAEILIDNEFYYQVPETGRFPLHIDTSLYPVLQEIYIHKQILEAYYEDLYSAYMPDSNRYVEFGNNATIIKLSDFIMLDSLAEVFKEIVPNVFIKRQKGTYVLQVYDDEMKMISRDPFVFVDNVLFSDLNQLMNLPVELVKEIHVYNQVFIWGDYTIKGIISIQTSSKDFGGMDVPASSVFVNYLGYERSSVIDPLYRIPDKISNIQWYPDLRLFNNDLVKKVHTADRPGTYDIVVRGYDKKGQFYFGSESFIVK